MSESPEVPDEEPSESKADMKERMRSLGEKAKAFGEKTGQRSKELGKKVAEATKETTAKAADATKKTTAKMAEAAKETTAKAAEAGKKAGSRLSESTADVSEKISVAAEQAAESVSKGMKQTKEKVKQAKEARDERKAQAAQVPQSTQVIALGPDLPADEKDQAARHDSEEEVPDMADTENKLELVKTNDANIMIAPPTGNYPRRPGNSNFTHQLKHQTKEIGHIISKTGADLAFGWVLLFVSIGTLSNSVILASQTQDQLEFVKFSIPHLDLALSSQLTWMNALGVGLLLILTFDSILLSANSVHHHSYRRITIACALTWLVPRFSNGLDVTSGPVNWIDANSNDAFRLIFWHIFILPGFVLFANFRGRRLKEMDAEKTLKTHLSGEDGLFNEHAAEHKSASFSYTPTLKSLPELRPMNAPDGLLDKPKRRDSMEFYEWVFFLFMWLFIFAGVAMGVMAAQANDAANSVLQSSYMPAVALCLGLAVVLAYILFRMDRAARSGIDMAKRRERFHAMQDEVWETWRTEARLKREQLEQEHNEGTTGVTA